MHKKTATREADSLRVKKMTYAALYLALAMLLPFVTGQIPEIGSMLCPMHIPALLCGFMCGWPWGLAAGFISAPLRSVLFGMPPMFPDAVAMAFELGVYGAAAGILYRVFPRKILWTYTALVLSMLLGRAVWGVAHVFLMGLTDSAFSWNLFLTRGFVNAVPGILLQLILIPPVVTAMEKAGICLNRP